jgi:hypothetical protein
MEEIKLSRRYSITAAISRWVALKLKNCHEIIWHGLDIIYPRNRHEEQFL